MYYIVYRLIDSTVRSRVRLFKYNFGIGGISTNAKEYHRYADDLRPTN